jgi:hypothetical protein
VPEVVAVTFKSVLPQGQLCVNTIHYEIEDATIVEWNKPSMDARADAVYNTMGTEYRALLPNTATLQTVTVKQCLHPGSSDIPQEAVKVVNALGTRSSITFDLKPALCAVVDLKTSFASRSGRGWLFAPPAFTSGALSGSALGNFSTAAGSYYLAVQAWAAKLDDSLDMTGLGLGIGGDWMRPRVYSKTRHGRDQTPFVFEISGVTVDLVPRWLRSRNTAP